MVNEAGTAGRANQSQPTTSPVTEPAANGKSPVTPMGAEHVWLGRAKP